MRGWWLRVRWPSGYGVEGGGYLDVCDDCGCHGYCICED